MSPTHRIPLKPSRGGFLRPFGCGEFIREFLLGHGPHGSAKIDPRVGVSQAEIFFHYKNCLRQATALDRATRAEERSARKARRPVDPDRIEGLYKRYLAHLPYKANGCRYHSFIVYFTNIKRLGWVEPTGGETPSAFQDHYPPGPPRRNYRLTAKGKRASDVAWRNPRLALYGP